MTKIISSAYNEVLICTDAAEVIKLLNRLKLPRTDYCQRGKFRYSHFRCEKKRAIDILKKNGIPFGYIAESVFKRSETRSGGQEPALA